MKKLFSLFLVLTIFLALSGCGHKDLNHLPSLEVISKMDEGDVNGVLPGYQIDQLNEKWGIPNDSEVNESVWNYENTRIIVNYNWLGEVVVCSLEKIADSDN